MKPIQNPWKEAIITYGSGQKTKGRNRRQAYSKIQKAGAFFWDSTGIPGSIALYYSI